MLNGARDDARKPTSLQANRSRLLASAVTADRLPRQEMDQYLFKAGRIHDVHRMASARNSRALSRGQALMRGINDARKPGRSLLALHQ